MTVFLCLHNGLQHFMNTFAHLTGNKTAQLPEFYQEDLDLCDCFGREIIQLY